ncbi:MAG: SRPBCC domain-containing protein [Sphingosinicella sp.]|nr:SRPBCC domain-containing protein [Sphingosinicella sp.]
MNDLSTMVEGREIVVDEIMPHSPDLVWKTLTTPEYMGRWLMEPTGFAPEKGNHFTYTTTGAGEWDGTIECEVLEAEPGRRLVHSWVGGHESNNGYGSRLDTILTWTLTPVDGGTRIRLVHSGFQSPKNDTAFTKMSEGWPKVVESIGSLTGEAN